MRMLHTSDWHLGRTLHRADLRQAQTAFLDHLVETVRSEKIDAVLVSGDVYDRAIPPVDAVALCEDGLFRLRDAGARVIVYQSSTPTFQGTWGPDQHASLAALRAAETGRPVVQAALTGDTVAFDARGRELAWLGQQQHGVVTVHLDLAAAADQTFYDRAGDYVMWTGVGVTGLAALVMLARWRGFLGNNTGIGDGSTAECDADTGEPVRTQ